MPGRSLRTCKRTDDAQAVTTYGVRKGEHLVEQSGGETLQNVATAGENGSMLTEAAGKPQALTLSRNDNRQQPLATAGESTPGWIRTNDHRFRKPVLYPLSYEGVPAVGRLDGLPKRLLYDPAGVPPTGQPRSGQYQWRRSSSADRLGPKSGTDPLKGVIRTEVW